MNKEIALKIINANGRIETLRELNTRFLQHLAKNCQPERVPGKITVEENKISIDCFGYTAVAESRVVDSGDRVFWMEYVFSVNEHDLEYELWRFYLSPNGYLETLPNNGDHICDYDNRYVADYICKAVLHSALGSMLFAPKEKN